MKRSQCTWFAALLICGSLVQLAVAADGNALIRQAYEKTKTASAEADYEAVIELCGQARQEGLDSGQENYAKTLLAWAHNRRGEIYNEQAGLAHQRGQVDQAAQLDAKALADFEAAIQLDGTRWKSWHNRGVSYAIAGKYQDAIADFSKVIELNPTYANAFYNRAEIRIDIGQAEEALQDYTEAIRLDPRDAQAFTGRGHGYMRLGKYAEALADYDEVVKLLPRDALALLQRAETFQSLERWQQAAEDLRQAVELDPGSARVLQGVAWLMATCPEAGIRNGKLAVEAAEKAVQLTETPDSRFLDTLAAAYANAGQFQQAVAKQLEALQSATPSEAAPLQLRLALYRQQQPYRQGQRNKTASAPRAASTSKAAPRR